MTVYDVGMLANLGNGFRILASTLKCNLLGMCACMNLIGQRQTLQCRKVELTAWITLLELLLHPWCADTLA